MLLAATACTPSTDSETPASQARSAHNVSFEKIAPGVWLHVTYSNVPGFGAVRSNGLIVAQGDHSVLIDTGWTNAETRSILRWARDTLDRPITAAVVTHAHDDKMGGMAALHEAGVKTFAFRLTNDLAPKRDLIAAQAELEFGADGHLTQASARKAEPLGDIELFYPGPGHTSDNIVVGIAKGTILFGGCLIRPADATSMGNTADGDVQNWDTAALAAGGAFPDAELVVPSHGELGGNDLITHTANLAKATQTGP